MKLFHRSFGGGARESSWGERLFISILSHAPLLENLAVVLSVLFRLPSTVKRWSQ